MTQHHHPKLHADAYMLAKLASTSSDHETLDDTVHITARPSTTTYLATDTQAVLRVTIPTIEPKGEDWEFTIRDDSTLKQGSKLADTASKIDASPQLPGMEDLITLSPSDTCVNISLDRFSRISLRIVDVDFDADQLNLMIDNFAPDSVFNTEISSDALSRSAQIEKIVGTDATTYQWSQTAALVKHEQRDKLGALTGLVVEGVFAIKGSLDI